MFPIFYTLLENNAIEIALLFLIADIVVDITSEANDNSVEVENLKEKLRELETKQQDQEIKSKDQKSQLQSLEVKLKSKNSQLKDYEGEMKAQQIQLKKHQPCFAFLCENTMF